MNLTEFLDSTGFRSHGTVTNSWDAFRPDGTVLMQLWTAPGQRLKDGHDIAGAYLRVRCFDAAHHAVNEVRQAVGYAGRLRAIHAVEAGVTAYAALSSPPSDKRGPGLWAKHADLGRVYRVLGIERPEGCDIFAILGGPISVASMK